MWMVLLLTLILASSCTTDQGRWIASEQEFVLGSPAVSKSRVMLYPSEHENEYRQFYLELRDEKNSFVDVDKSEIVLKMGAKKVGVSITRLSQGRYQLFVTQKISNLKNLIVMVQKKNLSHKLSSYKIPSKSHSKMTLLEVADNNSIRMRLVLKDQARRNLETQSPPDVIFEGHGEISELQMIEKGVWEFRISYPELNQLFYLSVRANGLLLERLFRHQHVEK